MAQDLAIRLTQPPPSIRAVRPDVPEELDAILRRMMAVDREQRFASPAEVRQALLPWVAGGKSVAQLPRVEAKSIGNSSQICLRQADSPITTCAPRTHRILIVDDEPGTRALCLAVLKAEGLECAEAEDGTTALSMLLEGKFDLALVDLHMPGMNGLDLCRKVRELQPVPHLKLIAFSGFANPDDVTKVLQAGADDFLSKPFSVVQMQTRIKAALRLKEAQDRADALNAYLMTLNRELEQNSANNGLHESLRDAILHAISRLVERRDGSPGSRTARLQGYVRALAEEAAREGLYERELTEDFIEMLVAAVPLMDVGKVSLPDHILLKPGKLSDDERLIMQTHAAMAGEMLHAASERYPSARAFLQLASDLARHHHERYDGTGYPDRKAGTDIPLAARLVAPCDVYDALRSWRLYRPGLSHPAALEVMKQAWQGQFDPALRQCFLRCAGHFEKIFREQPE
jgi:response regulator RpfG family c-di-GMP phosphodiesterase